MNKLTAKEFASRLNERKIHYEITRGEADVAMFNRLVVLYGASDDLMEFDGAIDEEIDCYEGTTVYLDKQGNIVHRADYEDLDDYTPDYIIPDLTKTKYITSIWNNTGNPCWYYSTDIPHETFDIMKDGEVFCRGIVFSMDDLI